MSEDKVTSKMRFDVREVKEVEHNGQRFGIISGYASTYGNVDRVRDKVMPGAFTKSVKRYLSDSRPIKMYYQHDSKEVIGAFRPEFIREDVDGLFVQGELNLDVQKGREVYALARQGVLTDLSIGYTVKDSDVKNGIRELKEVELWEISVVSEPANPKARITQVKTIDEIKEEIKSKRDFERYLRELGVSKNGAVYLSSFIDEAKFNTDAEIEQIDNESESQMSEEVQEVKSEQDVIIADTIKRVSESLDALLKKFS